MATPTETNTPTIKAILFDMDGTLLDTEALSDKAILLAFGTSLPAKVLEEPPMSSYSVPWELKKQVLGLRGAEWVPLVLDYAKKNWDVTEEMNPPDAAQFWKNWEDQLNSMCQEIDACKGARELVQALASYQPAFPMAIATSSRYAGVEKKKVRHDAIFRHMTAIVAGDDPAVIKGKPAPDIYLEAARKLNVNPNESLVFEDALSGVRAGKAAGCYVVAIPDTRFSQEEKAVFVKEADMVVDDLSQFDGRVFGIDIDMRQLGPKLKIAC